jgi:hypothetical protein
MQFGTHELSAHVLDGGIQFKETDMITITLWEMGC